MCVDILLSKIQLEIYLNSTPIFDQVVFFTYKYHFFFWPFYRSLRSLRSRTYIRYF